MCFLIDTKLNNNNTVEVHWMMLSLAQFMNCVNTVIIILRGFRNLRINKLSVVLTVLSELWTSNIQLNMVDAIVGGEN